MGIVDEPNPFRENSVKVDMPFADDSNQGRMLTYKIYIVQTMLELALRISTRELQDLYTRVDTLVATGRYLEILELIESYDKD